MPSPLAKSIDSLNANGYLPHVRALAPPDNLVRADGTKGDGKAPGTFSDGEWHFQKNWQKPESASTVDDIPAMKTWPGAGLGLVLGDDFVAFDFDFDLEKLPRDLRRAAKALCRRIIEIIADKVGVEPEELPLRTRSNSKSRLAVILRVSEAISKMTLTFHMSETFVGQLEILGKGQQLVIEATHHSGARVSSTLTRLPLASLPVKTPAEVDDMIAEIEQATAKLGFTTAKPQTASAKEHDKPPFTPAQAVERAVHSHMDLILDELLPTLTKSTVAGEAYRISSADLGRDLQEALVVYEDGHGIYDYGTRRRHTPVSLACEFGVVNAVGGIQYGGSPYYKQGEGDVFDVAGEPEKVRRPTEAQALTWLRRLLTDVPNAPEFPEGSTWKNSLPHFASACGLDWHTLNEVHQARMLADTVGDTMGWDKWKTADDYRANVRFRPAMQAIDPEFFAKHEFAWDLYGIEAERAEAPDAGNDEPLFPTEAPFVPGESDLSDWDPWKGIGGPRFPLDTLPKVIQDYCVERSKSVGTDISAYVMTCFATMCGVIDHRVGLKVKANDNYRVHPNMWIMLVGPPSTRKSAPVRDAMGFLRLLDKRDKAAHASIRAAGEAEARAAGCKAPAVPPPRKRMINDVTIEYLCEVLSHQDCGVILVDDELSAWLGGMQKYSGKDGSRHDRGIWLQARDGGSRDQGRMRGSRDVDNLSCAVLGGIQPDLLKDMEGLDADGMVQRFIPVMLSKASPEGDMPAFSTADLDFKELLTALDAIPSNTLFRFSAEARAHYLDFSHEMAGYVDLAEPSPAFGTFCGKQARTLGELSLLLHLAEYGSSAPTEIPVETVRRALTIMNRFVIPHAHAFYTAVDRRNSGLLRSVAAFLVKKAGGAVTSRDLMRGTGALRDADLPTIQRAMLAFIGHGWAGPVTDLPSNNKWVVNTALADRFKRQLDEHIDAHRRLIEKIRGGGKQDAAA